LKIELAKTKDTNAPDPVNANKLLSMMFACLKRAMNTVNTIAEGLEKQKPEEQTEEVGLG